MTTAPYAKLRANIAGAGNLSGSLVGASGATCQLSQDPAGLGSSWLYEITDYPEGWAVPAGWTADPVSGVYSYAGLTPPSFTLPADPLWGKLAPKLTVNNGDPGTSGLPATQFVDKSTVISTPEPGGSGFEDIAYGETNQWDAQRKWIGPHKRNIRRMAALGAFQSAKVSTTTAAVTTVFTLPLVSNQVASLGIRVIGLDFASNDKHIREWTCVYRRQGAAAPTQWGTDNDLIKLKDDANFPLVSVSGNSLIVTVQG